MNSRIKLNIADSDVASAYEVQRIREVMIYSLCIFVAKWVQFIGMAVPMFFSGNSMTLSQNVIIVRLSSNLAHGLILLVTWKFPKVFYTWHTPLINMSMLIPQSQFFSEEFYKNFNLTDGLQGQSYSLFLSLLESIVSSTAWIQTMFSLLIYCCFTNYVIIFKWNHFNIRDLLFNILAFVLTAYNAWDYEWRSK